MTARLDAKDEAVRGSGQKPTTGYLAASFDLLNVAHLDAIRDAGSRCDRLVVGVLTDEQVQERWGRAPVVPLIERAVLVSHVRGVSEAVVHGSEGQRALGVDLVFCLRGETRGAVGGVIELEPTRTTASRVLRAALSRSPDEVVA